MQKPWTMAWHAAYTWKQAILCRWLVYCLAASLPSCGKPDMTVDQPIHAVPATDSRILVMGRAQEISDGRLTLAYPGVTLLMNITASAAWLKAYGSTEQSHLEIIVDNREPQIVKLSTTSQRIPLFLSAEPDSHQVRIIHRSETWHGVVTVQGMELIEGELLAPPELPDKRMLILGDSVTCGEAIERNPDCQKNSSWWNPRQSYGMLIAQALDAQVHLVCYGGRGLIRSWHGGTEEQNLPDFFELAIANPEAPIPWDHSRYSPDLILSAIGTNDFSQGIPYRDTYIAAYVKFVERLMELHPQSEIVLTEGAILSGEKKSALREYLVETATRLANPRLHIIPSNHYPGDQCDAHPTKEQHAAMAEDLTPLLRQWIGQGKGR